eukprot:797287_1
MRRTVDGVVSASEHPLSIIIIGLGRANFEKMEFLDSDDDLLISSSGERMERDIVQFLPFRKFEQSPWLLARETLAEIPEQFGAFVRQHKVEPMRGQCAPQWAEAVGVRKEKTPSLDVRDFIRVKQRRYSSSLESGTFKLSPSNRAEFSKTSQTSQPDISDLYGQAGDTTKVNTENNCIKSTDPENAKDVDETKPIDSQPDINLLASQNDDCMTSGDSQLQRVNTPPDYTP